MVIRCPPLLLALVMFAPATAAIASESPSQSDNSKCMGMPFPSEGYVVGITPPSHSYESTSPKPYILGRSVAGSVHVLVSVLTDAGECRPVCDQMMETSTGVGLTCPVRILFPGRTAFVQVDGLGLFAICEADVIPMPPC